MQREELLSLAFDQSPDGLLLMHPDGQLIDFNPAAMRLLGFTDRDAMFRLRPTDVAPEFQPDGTRSSIRVAEVVQEAQRNGSACLEWTHLRADGQPLHVEVLLTHIECDGQDFIHINWRDINVRREMEDALAYRQSLEALLIRFSSYFINLPTEDIDTGIDQALAELGEFVEADRSYVFAYDGDFMHNRYEWCAEGIAPQIERMQHIPVDVMSWSNTRIRRGEILNTPVVADLPPEAQAEKDEFIIQHIQSVLVVPMERRGHVVGFMGFDAVRQQRLWPDAVVDLLRIAAGIIANVLDRRDAELALRETNATLEIRVRERTHELLQRQKIAESLRETLVVVNSNQSLEDTLDHLVKQAATITKATAATLYSVNHEKETGRIEATYDLFDDDARSLEFDLNSTSGQELLGIIQSRKPLAFTYDKRRIEMIRNDPNVSEFVRERRLHVYERYMGSVSVPLFVRDEPFGALLLYYDSIETLNEQPLEPVMTLAEQAALAIENARLHEAAQEKRTEAEQRRRVAEGLRDGLAILNSDRPLGETLDFVILQAVQLLETGGGALYLLDPKEQMLYVGASYGLDDSYTSLPLPVGGAITGRAVARGEPVSVPDMAAASELLAAYLHEPNISKEWMRALRQLRERYNAVLSVPVTTRGQVYGAITLYYPEHQQFSDDVIGLAVAFAGQAALVIENARLRERVRETAVVEERNRLARDLHDAVTQTLFSASMIADSLPDLWRIDREDAETQLGRLSQLTRGALAEMRSLLIELRPGRLVETDMKTLLQQLIDAARGRSKLNIRLNLQGNCELPADTKIVFYRVAQEALNNIIKHAGAQHVFMSMRCDGAQVSLQILDDGRGFDLQTIPTGHFGVQIMAERAAGIGAELVIDTHPGEGTDIQLIWSWA